MGICASVTKSSHWTGVNSCKRHKVLHSRKSSLFKNHVCFRSRGCTEYNRNSTDLFLLELSPKLKPIGISRNLPHQFQWDFYQTLKP